jgi:hypothetical protein
MSSRRAHQRAHVALGALLALVASLALPLVASAGTFVADGPWNGATEAERPEMPLTEPCTGAGPNDVGENLCGTVNPHSRARTSYHFAYNAGEPCTGGARTAAQEVEGEDVGVFGEVNGLEPNTSYTACLVAVTAGGEAVGNEVAFVTTPAVPAVVDLSAGTITQHDAVLGAEINPQGLATTYEFRLESPVCRPAPPEHCEATGGYQIATGGVPAGHDEDKVSVDIAEVYHQLVPSTTYGYSVVAANSAGETVSTQQSFTTSAEPISPPSLGVPPSTQGSLAPTIQAPQQTAAASSPEGPSAAVLGPLAVPTNKRGTPRGKGLRAALEACERASRKTRAQCRRQAQEKYGHRPSTRQRAQQEFTFER